MEEMIYLTKEQADKVRGRHGRYSALMPLLTDDGKYVLPKDVLNDEEHIETFGTLIDCKKAEVEPEFIKINEEISACVFKVKNISSTTIYEKIPDSWVINGKYNMPKLPQGKDILTKGLGLFNYSKPVTNFRGEKVGRWSLVKDLLKEIWRRIKNLFKCNTK